RSEIVEEALYGVPFESQFAPFVDETAGFDDATSGGQSEIIVPPPNAAYGHHSMEFPVIPEAEWRAKMVWAAKATPPIEQLGESFAGAGQGTQRGSGVEFEDQVCGIARFVKGHPDVSQEMDD